MAVTALRIASGSPTLRTVALGNAGGRSEVAAATRAGATYLSPQATLLDLLPAIASRGMPSSPAVQTGAWRLTRREMEVADFVAADFTNAEIAAALCLSLATVKNHVHSVITKLDVRDRVEAAAVWRTSVAYADRLLMGVNHRPDGPVRGLALQG